MKNIFESDAPFGLSFSSYHMKEGMKMKRILLLIAFLLLLSACALSEENLLNIKQLRMQTPENWTQDFHTPWRSVVINTEIRIPDVDRLPVALVRGGMEEPVLPKDEMSWDHIRTAGGYDLYLGRESKAYPKRLDGKRLNQELEAHGTWSIADPMQTYVPMSDLTLSDIADQMEAEMLRFGFNPQEYGFRTPFAMQAQHMYYWGEKRDALPGTLAMNYRFRLFGVAVLDHIHSAVIDYLNGESRMDEWVELPNSYAIYSGYSKRLISLALWRAETEKILADDVPLCTFDVVRSAVEAEIMAGHIRKVFEIELGYMLYNEPGVYRCQKFSPNHSRTEIESERAQRRYYVKPVWMINCLWVDHAQKEQRGISHYTENERNTLNYRSLYMDAQTGIWLKESREHERCEFPGFIEWNMK